MTHPPRPTEPFAQHSRLSELVTALGFRRYPLFLTGLLYQEAGGPLRRASTVASRDGDLVAYDTGEAVELAGRVPASRLFNAGGPRRRWWTPWPTATRRSSPTRWPAGPGAAAASTRSASSCCTTGSCRTGRCRRPSLAPRSSGWSRSRSPDALLDTFRRLADRHQRGFLVEQVMELLATS